MINSKTWTIEEENNALTAMKMCDVIHGTNSMEYYQKLSDDMKLSVIKTLIEGDAYGKYLQEIERADKYDLGFLPNGVKTSVAKKISSLP